MEVPRRGVELELLAYAMATATQDPSHVFDLHHSSWQRWILNPLSQARDQIRVLMDTSCVRYLCATTGAPWFLFFIVCMDCSILDSLVALACNL